MALSEKDRMEALIRHAKPVGLGGSPEEEKELKIEAGSVGLGSNVAASSPGRFKDYDNTWIWRKNRSSKRILRIPKYDRKVA